jgi:plastocyanin
MRVSTVSVVSVALVASGVQADHFDVTVGKGGELKFDPPTIKAKEGDTVTYTFYAKVSKVSDAKVP